MALVEAYTQKSIFPVKGVMFLCASGARKEMCNFWKAEPLDRVLLCRTRAGSSFIFQLEGIHMILYMKYKIYIFIYMIYMIYMI